MFITSKFVILFIDKYMKLIRLNRRQSLLISRCENTVDLKMVEEKRKVPSKLRRVLNVDVLLTKEFHHWAVKNVDLENYSHIFKALELSCHNVTWIVLWIALIFLSNKDETEAQMHLNLLLGVFLDVLTVAVLKAYARRRRPSEEKGERIGQSFPSGHASRAVFVANFFINLYPLELFAPILILWAFSVCASRVLSYRHHFLDVLGGAAIGYSIYYLLTVFYIDAETASSIINYFE